MIPVVDEITLGAKVLGFFKGLPSWVYIALAVAALLGAGAYLHHRAVKSAYDAAYNQGVADERAREAAANKKLATKQAAITAPIRKTNDETNTRIAGDADDLRLSGPGKAAVRCPTPATAGQPGAASDQRPDAAPGGAVAEDGLSDFAAVPWGWLVGRAEQADLDRAEVLAWRDWYAKQTAAEQAADLQENTHDSH